MEKINGFLQILAVFTVQCCVLQHVLRENIAKKERKRGSYSNDLSRMQRLLESIPELMRYAPVSKNDFIFLLDFT